MMVRRASRHNDPSWLTRALDVAQVVGPARWLMGVAIGFLLALGFELPGTPAARFAAQTRATLIIQARIDSLRRRQEDLVIVLQHHETQQLAAFDEVRQYVRALSRLRCAENKGKAVLAGIDCDHLVSPRMN